MRLRKRRKGFRRIKPHESVSILRGKLLEWLILLTRPSYCFALPPNSVIWL